MRGAVKPKPHPLGGVDVSMHGSTPAEVNYAIPIPNDPIYDIIRYYFIPMKVVDPAVTDNTIFGIICQKFGRHYWLMVNPSLAYKLEFAWVSTVFPLKTGPQPSPFHFTIVNGTIKNLLYNKYVKAVADTPIFSLETNSSDPNCQFSFYWATGTGPVMPTVPNITTNAYYILTSGGKALVGSATAPFISWATLDVTNNAQMFYFHAVSGPTLSSNAPFVYNMLCLDVPGKVFCFGDNGIDIRPVEDAGDWEQLAIEMGPSSLPEYFSRFKVTGTSFLARLRAHADVTGSVTLADKNSLQTIEDFFFVLPVIPIYINPKDRK
eukprot:GDKJ01056667.1.p1 GENE.GDKJ01056667.1~~GDKJ01056667.1.p1  ORF type:complete len:321 (-),score=-17.06 GDKJ01056667.1:108-1070(-)